MVVDELVMSSCYLYIKGEGGGGSEYFKISADNNNNDMMMMMIKLFVCVSY